MRRAICLALLSTSIFLLVLTLETAVFGAELPVPQGMQPAPQFIRALAPEGAAIESAFYANGGCIGIGVGNLLASQSRKVPGKKGDLYPVTTTYRLVCEAYSKTPSMLVEINRQGLQNKYDSIAQGIRGNIPKNSKPVVDDKTGGNQYSSKTVMHIEKSDHSGDAPVSYRGYYVSLAENVLLKIDISNTLNPGEINGFVANAEMVAGQYGDLLSFCPDETKRELNEAYQTMQRMQTMGKQ